MADSSNCRLTSISSYSAGGTLRPMHPYQPRPDLSSGISTRSVCSATDPPADDVRREIHQWDNAVSESFFGQLKNEWAWQQDYPDRDQARAALYEYIELFYNDQRLHQTLGYIPPVEYEKKPKSRLI